MAVCRICLGGNEEAAELGRLISPCKCKGSTRYVHIMCLQQWRNASANTDNFYRCDICHYNYNLRRVRWASRLLSPWARATVTILLLNIMSFVLGYAAYPILETTLTDDDIDTILRLPNIILRKMGINVQRRIIRRGGFLERHTLGTAAIGTIGLLKFSWSYFYMSTLRRRRNLSLILVLAGLAYSMYTLYQLTGKVGHWILRFLANWIVSDVPEDLGDEEDAKNK